MRWVIQAFSVVKPASVRAMPRCQCKREKSILSATGRFLTYSAVGIPVIQGSGSGDSFFRLPTAIGTLLLRLVVGVRLFVIVAAFGAEKEQNLLRVSSAHTGSLARWQVVGKRSTLS